MPTIKKIQRYGNGHAIVLDKPLMDAIDLKVGDPVALSVEGGAIVLRPAREPAAYDRRFEKAMQDVNERYAEVFKKLAE
jgi:antitoxin component of MazEF toxin-antitoxin module